MGFIDFFKNKLRSQANKADPFGDNAYQENHDYFTEKKCPNCQFILKQVNKKNNCPSCKETIIVDRHYKTKKKMLLTKEQAERLAIEKKHFDDLNWATKLAEKMELSTREISAMAKSTQVNTKFSVLWNRANDMAMNYAQKSKWQSYRDMRLMMAEITHKDHKLQKALEFYLAVCYLDLNGPDDSAPYEAKKGDIKQSIINTIREICTELGITPDRLEEIYVSCNLPEKNSFIPLSPQETWPQFLKAYKKT
ncbi:hypothetical protein DealDRAFT_0822 [Dethiobacter alkaliphilus AHT 1]|uniref:Uncharacterized protein n=2 Tax=Dethiobacter TaxID=427925 RepID=C0GEB3_DETAL|nr:hypothetical protein DealDRAFT_0822 [Dethiobacter alkaliphilus AHT 1]